MHKLLQWNSRVNLIVSDVDETVAPLYEQASQDMIDELEALLSQGKVLILISGAGFANIQSRVVHRIRPALRHRVLVGHCNGSEMWGFDRQGKTLSQPHYSLYEDSMTDEHRKTLRAIVAQIVDRFDLQTFPTMPLDHFRRQAGDQPSAVMLEDRGPQITIEFPNLLPSDVKSPDPGNLRSVIANFAQDLFHKNEMPIRSVLGGDISLDFCVRGASKAQPMKFLLRAPRVLSQYEFTPALLEDPHAVEVWGDRFSRLHGGTDRLISESLPPDVRSISFRNENINEFPKGYNIVVWNGKQRLQAGLLEFLKSRPRG